MDTSDFIDSVKVRRALWDPTYPKYHNKKQMQAMWKEIAAIFGAEVRTAKHKWKNLRDTFRVELKKNQRFAQDPETQGSNRTVWAHFEEMMFLKNSLKTRALIPEQFANVADVSPESEFVDNPSQVKFEVQPEESPATPSGLQIEDIYSVAENNNIQSSSSKKDLKRKRKDEGSDTEDECDDLHFFKSLLPFVKKLSHDKKLLFRMNVQQNLYEHLFNQ